jgi:outer membrane protein
VATISIYPEGKRTMKKRAPRAFLSLLLASVAVPGIYPASDAEAAAKKITIAVVRDGPTEMNEIVDRILPELEHLLGSDYDVTFDMSDSYDAGWAPQRVRTVIEAAMGSREVDMVVGIGMLVTSAALQSDVRLSKPFVSATLLDGDVPKLQFAADGTLEDNLSLVVRPQRTNSDIDAIRGLMQTGRVHVVLNRDWLENIPALRPALETYGREIGVEIIPVPVSDDWRPAMDQLGPDVEVVYFARTPRLTRGDRAAFVEALNERKIPTFSGIGPQDLEIGMLATNRQDMRQALVRRVALNLHQLITGASTDELPVLLISDSKLTINGRTAARIGFALSFEAMVLGTVLHADALEAGADSLNLGRVLAMADTGNIDLSISNQQVTTALRGKQVVRSPLLPQIGAGADYLKVDNNLVGSYFPDQWSRANLNLSQMIFDDQLISDFRSAGREYDAAMFQNESDRLDVYLEAQTAYLSFVQARLLYDIALNNLRLTEGNLEIAKMRVEVGHSGRDEVFRWTAELNQQRTLLMNIESQVETRRIQLNRVLGVDLGKRWRPEAVSEDAGAFERLREQFDLALQSQPHFARFAEATVEFALDNSPERKFLEASLEAEGIRLGERKRSFIVPKVFLDMSYNYNFWQSPEVPKLGDRFYEIRVTAALPLFEGTRRVYDMQLSKSLIVELERRLELVDQLVEQRTRNALRRIQASSPNIDYSRVAAENARKNFDVVRDKYANGIVNITDLVSAQNASFAADQDATVALYTFLLDSAEFQRAVSFFPDTRSQDEIDEFERYMRDKMESQEGR